MISCEVVFFTIPIGRRGFSAAAAEGPFLLTPFVVFVARQFSIQLTTVVRMCDALKIRPNRRTMTENL
jgi:hypothetical protein